MKANRHIVSTVGLPRNQPDTVGDEPAHWFKCIPVLKFFTGVGFLGTRTTPGVPVKKIKKSPQPVPRDPFFTGGLPACQASLPGLPGLPLARARAAGLPGLPGLPGLRLASCHR
jgi:hypothetical protein